jgi:hypothetical protein
LNIKQNNIITNFLNLLKMSAENKENKKEELIKRISSDLFESFDADTKAEAEAMLGTIRRVTKATDAQAVVRCRLYEGMEFEVSGIYTTAFVPDKDKPEEVIYTVFVTTNTGARIKSDYFGSVKDNVTIGVTDEEVCRFVAHHKKAKTTFKLSEYTPRKGKFTDDDYRPESGKVTVKA